MMHDVGHGLGEALLMAAGMAWKTGWSLALGFLISAVLQVLVSRESVQAALGREGWKETALAGLAGVASSSCSYASAAVSRTLFKKGAGLVPSLAFLLASTNLVVELGIILILLLGWPFAIGEWVGGVLLIAIVAAIVKLTYPRVLVEAARRHPEPGRSSHDHHDPESAGIGSWWERLRRPETRVAVAQHFVMDWGMLWKDVALGFLIAGALAAFVPDGVWKTLFAQGAPAAVQVPLNALIGPLVGVLSFVCSIGNVPMAAVLWGSGVSFGGVLAFLYSDLVVLPLLDVYRRYYGWKMAAYIAAVFYAAMVGAAVAMDIVLSALGAVPTRPQDVRAEMTDFSIDYTFWLNLIFGAMSLWLFIVARRHPMSHGSACEHHGHHHHAPSPAGAGGTVAHRH